MMSMKQADQGDSPSEDCARDKAVGGDGTSADPSSGGRAEEDGPPEGERERSPSSAEPEEMAAGQDDKGPSGSRRPRPRRHELLPGLHATLADDAVVYVESCGDGEGGALDSVHVSSGQVGLGRGSLFSDAEDNDPSLVVVLHDVVLRATVERCPDGALVMRDLDVAFEGGGAVDPRADEDSVLDFLQEYAGYQTLTLPPGLLGLEIRRSPVDGGCYVAAKDAEVDSPLEVGDRIESLNGTALAYLGSEAWQALFQEAANGEQTVVIRRSGHGGTASDVWIPNAKVGAFSLKYPGQEEPIQLPACEGTDACTLRTILEYYCVSVMRTMEVRSRAGVGKGRRANAARQGAGCSDVASTAGSVTGAALGGIFLGPAGFFAGSYLGGQFGRKHKNAVLGATAGACLFGPVGLLVGMAAGEEIGDVLESPNGVATGSTAGAADPAASEVGLRPESPSGNVVVDHFSDHRYEYAGTTGVVAGAAAGAVAGPIGMLAGALAGSLAARGGTQLGSDVAAETREAEGREGYRFGDVTRGIVARGKKSRGCDRSQSYKFGDFTRGLFG